MRLTVLLIPALLLTPHVFDTGAANAAPAERAQEKADKSQTKTEKKADKQADKADKQANKPSRPSGGKGASPAPGPLLGAGLPALAFGSLAVAGLWARRRRSF
ncbi:MAG TPA: hypothetical protein VD978_04880 [Azospirillum sp.]|nr:hypothetical protein [Azospirillum sp.]